ncbi:NUDIX hydrolase [Shewanella litorisediminis]|uniref:NUDIX domain-containing protein n=1 Tax=Shewanella litorisediminis TaxID=1173586 RepID=A0ABX7G3N4_9GAMM|nr:NUDIX domain-containing protein [Shewanella litorisediminis]MCL2919937.1 NUDIX domain-containing protein [Shewanella litorisediminis]QRH01878.1 NUDIX domain-containing protein [Shewanella litorisediminis]
MAFDDTFRLSCHGVITNDEGKVLLLKANYGNGNWGLPGGALEPGETIHQALLRECLEELGQAVIIDYLSGVYFHSAYNSQAFIFRVRLTEANIVLSPEHSEYAFFAIDSLPQVQQRRVRECLDFQGQVLSAAF